MHKFPSISQFYHVVNEATHYTEFHKTLIPSIQYYGTVKLHGTNTAISFVNGKIKFQSRNRLIDPTNDQYDFAKNMVNLDLTTILRLDQLDQKSNWTFYGEWCGPGIQKGIAVNQLPQKMFFIFSVLECTSRNTLIYHSPNILSQIDNDIILLITDKRFPSYQMEIDLYHPENYEEKLSKLTTQVDHQCPIANVFGIQGIGEGIVWVPDPATSWSQDPRWWFKTKGNTHKVTKERKNVSSTPEKANSIIEFVTNTCTEERYLQAIEYMKENQLKISLHNLGDFLKWIGQDIKRECQIILEKSELNWKNVSKEITSNSKIWYQRYLRTIND